jgi:hypothetical protein
MECVFLSNSVTFAGEGAFGKYIIVESGCREDVALAWAGAVSGAVQVAGGVTGWPVPYERPSCPISISAAPGVVAHADKSMTLQRVELGTGLHLMADCVFWSLDGPATEGGAVKVDAISGGLSVRRCYFQS